MQDQTATLSDVDADGGERLLQRLVQLPLADLVDRQRTATGVEVGEIVALADGGATALVLIDSAQPHSAALAARTVIDLHGKHIGQRVVLLFEQGNPTRPIVMGLLRGDGDPALAHGADHVELEADGERLVVSAKQQLVLRCGKASITLTRAGKVLVEGSYVLSRSTGVNRIKGGSVQLN